MFQTRIRSEDQARSSRPTPNHLLAQSLVDLLEERKYSKSKKELESLAHKYSIDLEKLERLARHVNSTSVDQTSVERWVGRDGNENVSVMVSILLSGALSRLFNVSVADQVGKPHYARRKSLRESAVVYLAIPYYATLWHLCPAS